MLSIRINRQTFLFFMLYRTDRLKLRLPNPEVIVQRLDKPNKSEPRDGIDGIHI